VAQAHATGQAAQSIHNLPKISTFQKIQSAAAQPHIAAVFQ